jgi:hypothetical protein
MGRHSKSEVSMWLSDIFVLFLSSLHVNRWGTPEDAEVDSAHILNGDSGSE